MLITHFLFCVVSYSSCVGNLLCQINSPILKYLYRERESAQQKVAYILSLFFFCIYLDLIHWTLLHLARELRPTFFFSLLTIDLFYREFLFFAEMIYHLCFFFSYLIKLIASLCVCVASKI